MRSILKLARANIKHGKGAFIGVIILMTLITYSFTGTVSNDDDLKRAIEDRFAAYDIKDVVVYIFDDHVTDEMLDDVVSHEYVNSCDISDYLLVLNPLLSNGEETDVNMGLCPVTDNTMMFSGDGKEIYHGEVCDGEIYIPYKLHASDAFSVGSVIAIRTHDGYTEEFTVKGYYEDVIMGPVTMSDNRAIISTGDYERIRDTMADHLDSQACFLLQIDEIQIKAEEGIDEVTLKNAITSDTDLVMCSNAAMTRTQIMDLIEMYSAAGTRTVIVFVVLLLIVIMITLNNCITSSIEMDYTELGILKSQGFTDNDIRLSYVIQYLAALFIGAVIGIGISIPLTGYLISLWKNISGIQSKTDISILKCAVLCLIIMAVSWLFIMFATHKVGKISPVRAINGGRVERYFDSRLKLRIRKKPLSFFMAFRNLQSGAKQYAGTLFITALLVFFVISVNVLKDGLDVDNILISLSGDIKVTDNGGFKLDDIENVMDDLRTYDSGIRIEAMSQRRMMVNDQFVTVVSYYSDRQIVKPIEGRMPVYDNEVCITKSIGSLTGTAIGDTITIESTGGDEEFVITGYFESVWSFGYVVTVTPEGMEKLGYKNIDSAFLILSDMSAKDDIVDHLNTAYEGRLSASDYEESKTSVIYKDMVKVIMNVFVYTIESVVIIFSAVIVVMVSKRTFIRERRDIGICKAVGFTSGGLRSQFSVRFALVAAFGSLLGGLLAFFLTRPMIVAILKIVGLTDFTSDYPPMAFIGPAALICLCFFACSYMISGSVKKVEVRELVTE